MVVAKANATIASETRNIVFSLIIALQDGKDSKTHSGHLMKFCSRILSVETASNEVRYFNGRPYCQIILQSPVP